MEHDSVARCRELLALADVKELSDLIDLHSQDPRAGVQSAIAAARRRLERSHAESDRLRALFRLQRTLHEQGFACVAGIDEVGRGALAGPVTAAAVVLPLDVMIPGLDDSKKLTPARREDLAAVIEEVAVTSRVAHVSPAEIDLLGIAAATRRAMSLALAGLDPSPDHVVVDGLRMNISPSETAVVKGDSLVASVAAASIVAKVTRDALMRTLADQYPAYRFEVNKGYGTSEHTSAIAEHGPCSLHRRSFAPCTNTRLF
ncbi:MAG: ribonuclease HII [Actinomycetota bacterium]|nr:ribonuclease HII [Actinomycetota bacterium]